VVNSVLCVVETYGYLCGKDYVYLCVVWFLSQANLCVFFVCLYLVQVCLMPYFVYLAHVVVE
jgi:hypothetical protein